MDPENSPGQPSSPHDKGGDSLKDASVDQSPGQWVPLDERTRPRRPINWRAAGLVSIALLLVLSAAYWAYSYRMWLSSGTIEAIQGTGLLVDAQGDGQWMPARVGQEVKEGMLLQARPGTYASVGFASGALMRIESEGEWQMLTLRASKSLRRSQTSVHQLLGTASYLARPPQRAVSAHLSVSTSHAALDLAGVATISTPVDNPATFALLDGKATLLAWEMEKRLMSSTVARVDPQLQSIVLD